MFYSDGWNGVPAGSELQVTLTGDEVLGVMGVHTTSRGAGTPVLQGNLDSTHFPLSIPVGAGEQHKVSFDVVFGGGPPAAVSMSAQVVLPGGGLFGIPSPCDATLTEKDPIFTVKLFANG